MTATTERVSFGYDYLRLVQSLPKFEGLSEALIHTDLGWNNVIQQQDGKLLIIDWDAAGRGVSVFDIGLPLILHFVTSGLSFERDKAAAYYDAYFANRSLAPEDRAMIFDAGLFFALAYMPHGDPNNNWARIQFAIENKKLISSVYE
jgi:thiamine kinase-like enzyme